MTRTYEELLAAQTELAHFNPNHDPRNGRFAKGSGVSSSSSSKASGGKSVNNKENFRKTPKEKQVKDLAIAGGVIVGGLLATYGAVKLKNYLDPTQRSLREADAFVKGLEEARGVAQKRADIIDELAKKYGGIEEIKITPSQMLVVVKK